VAARQADLAITYQPQVHFSLMKGYRWCASAP
jgi:hypothetical protein